MPKVRSTQLFLPAFSVLPTPLSQQPRRSTVCNPRSCFWLLSAFARYLFTHLHFSQHCILLSLCQNYPWDTKFLCHFLQVVLTPSLSDPYTHRIIERNEGGKYQIFTRQSYTLGLLWEFDMYFSYQEYVKVLLCPLYRDVMLVVQVGGHLGDVVPSFLE